MVINKAWKGKIVFNLEEELKGWKELLDTGMIDETTYNKEVDRIKNKAKKSKKGNLEFYNFIGLIVKVMLVMPILVIIICLYKNNNITKNVEYVQSLNNISKPRQTATSGNAVKRISNLSIELKYVATYNIAGRVINIHNYYGNSLQNQISPKDIGMSWGLMAKSQNYNKVSWTSLGDRRLRINSNDGKWLNDMGGIDKISEYCSNNHIIPSDTKVEKMINLIKEGNYIRLEGYLVNVFCQKKDGSSFKWNTSTSRTDTKDGACEILYVTNVVWLEEGNKH